jgi:hypothetical protein
MKADSSINAEIALNCAISDKYKNPETNPKIPLWNTNQDIQYMDGTWKRIYISLDNLFRIHTPDSIDASKVKKVIIAFAKKLSTATKAAFKGTVYIDKIGFCKEMHFPLTMPVIDTLPYQSKNLPYDIYAVINKSSSPIIYYYVSCKKHDKISIQTRDVIDLTNYGGVVLRFNHALVDSAKLCIATDGKILRPIKPDSDTDSLPPIQANKKDYKSFYFGSQ